MSVEAMAVVGLPLSVVETQLWDVTQWPTFLAGLRVATRSSHERYVFTVRQGRKDYDVLVAVRWQARDHRFTWRSLEGPPWDGTLRLAPVNGRRTRIFLQRKAYPRSFFASMAELLGAGVADPGLDLQRLQDRLAVLPAPARPARLRTVGRRGAGSPHAADRRGVRPRRCRDDPRAAEAPRRVGPRRPRSGLTRRERPLVADGPVYRAGPVRRPPGAPDRPVCTPWGGLTPARPTQ